MQRPINVLALGAIGHGPVPAHADGFACSGTAVITVAKDDQSPIFGCRGGPFVTWTLCP
jgi:hypothetical protein